MGHVAECGHTVVRKGARVCRKCWVNRGTNAHLAPEATTVDAVGADMRHRQQKRDDTTLRKRYDEALRTIERLELASAAHRALGERSATVTITSAKTSATSEATCVWVASDWHIEERVGPEVGDLNRYDLKIAEARAQTFFRSGLRLTNILAQDVKIETVILALLGDFITNDIHEELVEVNALSPVEALARVQSWLIAGIEFVLRESPYKLVIPCHSGNHARTTKTTRFGTEHGHSLEHLMYLHLAAHFRAEKRVQFLIPEGMHSYVTVYDKVIRFQHGHAIKYGGGVGGIYIPVNKAIAQWNKAKRADLDVFGHFHQMRDGGNFICNGSMIGYSSFALSIKADFERPKQALFLLDKRRGRTCTWPILFDV